MRPAPSQPVAIREDDTHLIEKIMSTLNTAGRTRILEHFREIEENENLKLTDLRGKWEAYHLLEYGAYLHQKDRSFFDDGFNKNKFDDGLDVLRRLPTGGAVGERRALRIFQGLADAQNVSLTECLLNFLSFCEERGYPFEVFEYDAHNLGVAIDDISFHLDPSFIRTRFPDDSFQAPVSATQPIPLRLPIFISKARALESDEVNLNPLDHYSIPLTGRTEQLRELNRFLNYDEKGVRILAVVAPSGAGKTRLVTEWMHKHVDKNTWECGLVEDADPKPWKEWEPSKNTLVVIDYVYRFDAVIHAIIKKAEQCKDFYIRLVVIDHVFPERLEDLPTFDYFTSALAEDAKEVDSRQTLFHPTLYLEKLPDRLAMLLDIISQISREPLDSPKVEKAKTLLVDIANDEGEEEVFTAAAYPLFAILIGEAMKDPNHSISRWKRYDVIRFYLDNKRRIPWAKGHEVDEDELGKWVGLFVSAATIRRGLSFRLLKKSLTASINLNADDINKIIAWCGRLVSSANRQWLRPFEPDILGENFFLLFFKFFANDTQVRELFIGIICSQDTYSLQRKDAGQDDIVGKFVEFAQRMARNLANDQKDNLNNEEEWEAFADFLNPELYKNEDETLYFAATAANMKVANVLRQKGLPNFIPLFFCQTDKEILKQFVGNQYSQLATEAFFYSFELSEEVDQSDEKFQKELLFVADTHKKHSENKSTALYSAAYFNCPLAVRSISNCRPQEKDRPNKYGWRPLLAACHLGNADAVNELIDANATLDYLLQNFSALMMAAQNGHESCLQALIEAKAPLDNVGKDGWSALMLAASNSHEGCLQALIKAKASLDIVSKDGLSALMLAASNGHEACLQALIKAKASLDIVDMNGLSALMLAASNGHEACLQALIKAKASLDTVSKDGWSTLVLAVSNGHEACLQALIEAKAPLDTVDKGGLSALMLAASKGYEACLQALIKAQAPLDTVDKNGWSALMLAASNGHEACLQALIKAKALLDTVDKNGWSTLMLAAFNGHEACMQALIKAKAPLDIVTKNGLSALKLAISNGHEACLQALIKAKAPLDTVGKNGVSALMLAASNGHEACLQALIEAQAPLDTVDKNGLSALMLAASNGHEACLQALIEAQAPLDTVDKNGWSALMLVVFNGHEACLQALIKAKALLDTVDKNGWSALMLAVSNGQEACLQALIKAKSPLDIVNRDGVSALKLAASNGHEACLQALIEAKAPLDTVDKDGLSALMLAASNGHEACLQALIKAKAPLDTMSNDGWSALKLAASKGHEACLQALIEAKAPLDTVDKDGWSALMLAAFNGHEACLQALIKAKAPLDTVSNDGWSALKLATFNGHEACLQALIEAKAPLDTVDKGGWSALMLAASKGHEACLQALIKAKAPLDTVDKDGWSALTLAIRFSQATTMKLLALIEVERNKLSSGFMPSLTRSFFLAENRGSIEGKVVVASEPLPLEHWKPLYFGNWDMLNNKEIEVLTSKVHEIGFGFLFCGLNIQHVRKTVLTFYKNCSLYELFFLLEDPIGIISYCSISFLFGDGKLILISGCASELHAANDAFHLSLNEKNVVDYLLFFNASLNADGEVLKAAHFPNDSSDIDKDYCEYIENINTSDSGRSHLVKGIIMTHEHKFLLLDYRVESNGMVEIHSEPEVIEGTCSVFEVIEFGVRYTKHRDLNKGS